LIEFRKAHIKFGKKSLAKLSILLVIISALILITFQTIFTRAESTGPQLTVEGPVIVGSSWSKKVTVYHNDSQRYQNIPVSTSIPENLVDVELYRFVDKDVMIKVTNNPGYVFQLIDTDDNGKNDTASWVVPELSEASFSVEGRLIEAGKPVTTTTQPKEINITLPEKETVKAQLVSEIGGEVKDVENNTVGKKIENEPDYETFFTFVGKENSNFIIRFYHNATESLPVWVEGNIDYSLTTSMANPLEEVNLTVPLIDGKIPKFRLHVGYDSDVFEFGITIIDVQSYPTLYGNWTVRFNTTGIADLTIKAVDGTEFDRDIEFLELRCGNRVLTTELTDGIVLVEDYSCDETGYEISKVLIAGKHALEFRFGDDVEYAYNQVGNTRLKTVEFFINTSKTQVAASAWFNSTFTIQLPENGISVKSAWFEVSGINPTTGDLGSIETYINGTFLVTQRIPQTDLTTETFGFTYLVNGTNSSTAPANGLYSITDNTARTFVLALRPLTIGYNALTAKAVITYAYDDASPTQLHTEQFFVNQSQNAAPLASATWFNSTFNVRLAGTSPSVKSAWFEVGAVYTTSADNHLLDVTLNNSQAHVSPYTIDATGSTDEDVTVIINVNATSSAASIYNINDNTERTFALGIRETGDVYTAPNAKLYVTYTTSTINQTTQEIFVNSTGTATATTVFQNWTFPVQLFGENPKVQTAWFEIFGSTSGTANDIDAFINGTQILAATQINDASGEWTNFRVFANARKIIDEVTDNSRRIYRLDIRCTGAACNALSAKLIVTYNFTNGLNQTTAKFYINSTPNEVAAGGFYNSTFKVQLTEKSPSVQRAFYEIVGSRGDDAADLTVTARSGGTAIPFDTSLWGQAAAFTPSYRLNSVYNATNSTTTATGTPYEITDNLAHTYDLSLQCSGDECFGLGSKLVMFYTFSTDATPPTFQYNNSNASSITSEQAVLLYANWTDNSGLGYAWLSTNETGIWQNKSGVYSSPIDINLTNGQTWSNFTWQNSSFTGVVAWKIYANDTSGNQNVTGEMYFTVTDTTPPIITVQSPVNNTVYPNNTIWFNVTLNEAGDKCLVNISNYNNTLTNSSGNWNKLNNTLSNGNYWTRFYCNDTIGNMNSSVYINFTIDTTPPIITVQSPVNNTVYPNNTIWFNVTLNEAGNVCLVNISNYNNTLTNSSGNWYKLNNTLANGNYWTRFYCNDTIGNTNSSVYINFTIDTTPPTYSNNVTSIANDTEYLPGRNYGFQIDWADNIAVSDVVFEWGTNNYTYLGGQVSKSDSTYYYNLTDLAAGTYTCKWYANDTSNKWNGSFPTITYVVKKNQTNPVDIYIVNTTGEYKNQNMVVIYGEQTNTTGTVYQGTGNLYRNDSLANTENNTLITLPGGTWKYTVNTTGTENYTTNSTSYYLTVNKQPTLTKLYLNGTGVSRTYIQYQKANFTVTLNVSGKYLNLTTNITGWSDPIDTTADSYFENMTNFTSYGIFNITGYFEGDENYTASSQTYYATVLERIWITNIEQHLVKVAAPAAAVAGYLEVNLINPPSPYSTMQNQTFKANASVTCRDGPCGEVNGTIRYNSSSSNPNTDIPTSSSTPFYLTQGSQPQTCGIMTQNQQCQLNWTVNATGNVNTDWKIGVLFSSNQSGVASNHTSNSTVTIISCSDSITLWNPATISFGEAPPNKTQEVNATSNSQKIYNITVNSGSCTLDLWIKGTDLENTTYSSIIGVGNMTWNNTNSYASSSNMTTSYTLVNQSVSQNTNVTTYYWLKVYPVYAGNYNGTITICGNSSASC
jgi:hypothetical protein